MIQSSKSRATRTYRLRLDVLDNHFTFEGPNALKVLEMFIRFCREEYNENLYPKVSDVDLATGGEEWCFFSSALGQGEIVVEEMPD